MNLVRAHYIHTGTFIRYDCNLFRYHNTTSNFWLWNNIESIVSHVKYNPWIISLLIIWYRAIEKHCFSFIWSKTIEIAECKLRFKERKRKWNKKKSNAIYQKLWITRSNFGPCFQPRYYILKNQFIQAIWNHNNVNINFLQKKNYFCLFVWIYCKHYGFYGFHFCIIVISSQKTKISNFKGKQIDLKKTLFFRLTIRMGSICKNNRILHLAL